MDAKFSEDVCAICLDSMKAGEGKALFTAECSHTFHFNCIASSVSHANRTCPTCRSHWNHLPSLASGLNNPVNHPVPLHSSPSPSRMSISRQENYADDEPILSSPVSPSTGPGAGELSIKALPGYSAVTQSESRTEFPVLVSLRAPALGSETTSDQAGEGSRSRAPLDLVAVLDVSGSMSGTKLSLVKEAMRFVIENLSPRDRLSIVCFSNNAWRITKLKRMSDEGRRYSIAAVDELVVRNSTNIIAGLRVGIQVLEQRREKNDVASIILLSDGADNCNGHSIAGRGRGFNLALKDLSMPSSVPVHTFGFGSDHDAAALHAISDVSAGGTFSFVESVDAIKLAFAQCIGGLLSVVTQKVEVSINSALPRAVKIESVSSGRYKSELDQVDGLSARIHVGDMSAEEKKHFLVYLTIPPIDPQQASSSSSSSSSSSMGITQLLLHVTSSYTDPLTKKSLTSETKIVEIRRPEELTTEDRKPNVEVELQRNRILVAETIGKAKAMAENGDFEGAQLTLNKRTRDLTSFIDDCAADGDEMDDDFKDDCIGFQAELEECSARLSNKRVYESEGRGYMLSRMNSHAGQKCALVGARRTGSGRRSTGGGAPRTAYITPLMQGMVAKAQAHNNISNIIEDKSDEDSSDDSDQSPPKRTKPSARRSTGGVSPATL